MFLDIPTTLDYIPSVELKHTRSTLEVQYGTGFKFKVFLFAANIYEIVGQVEFKFFRLPLPVGIEGRP